MELYRNIGPRTFDQIVGQDDAVKVLTKLIEKNRLPHAILFTGQSGTGKTTMARILAKHYLNARFSEINCGSCEPLETIRDLELAAQKDFTLLKTPYVWILDEFQALSRAQHAQQACNKLLEEAPAQAYYFICTTNPEKIIEAVKTRCTLIKLQPVHPDAIGKLIVRVLKKLGKTFQTGVVRAITLAANGSPRRAMVILEKVIEIDDPEEQKNAIDSVEEQNIAIQLCRVMSNFKVKPRWSDLAPILKGIEGEDAEGIRRLVLAYFRSIMIRGNGPLLQRSYEIIETFRDNVYDSGHAGLAAMCYSVCK